MSRPSLPVSKMIGRSYTLPCDGCGTRGELLWLVTDLASELGSLLVRTCVACRRRLQQAVAVVVRRGWSRAF